MTFPSNVAPTVRKFQASPPWQCKKCLLDNPGYRLQCQHCNERRPDEQC